MRKKKLSDAEARKKILDGLKERYGRIFEIKSLEKENIGQNFGKYQFIGILQDTGKEKAVFHARMGLYGEGLRDDYGRLLFGKKAEENVRRIFEDGGLSGNCFKIIHSDADKKYEDFFSYCSGHLMTVTSDLSINGIEEEKRRLYRFIESLRDAGYYFSLCVRSGGNSGLLIYSDISAFPAWEDMCMRLGEG